MWLTVKSVDFEWWLPFMLWMGFISLVEALKNKDCNFQVKHFVSRLQGRSPAWDSSLQILDSRLQHRLLPEFPACWPALQILKLSAPIIARTNSLKSLSLFAVYLFCFSVELWLMHSHISNNTSWNFYLKDKVCVCVCVCVCVREREREREGDGRGESCEGQAGRETVLFVVKKTLEKLMYPLLKVYDSEIV